MRDDEAMDDLLRTALAADVPRLSAGFDAAVMRRVQPRQVSARGRVVLAAYALGALLLSAWSLRGLDPTAIGVGLPVVVAVAGGASAYVRRLIVQEVP